MTLLYPNLGESPVPSSLPARCKEIADEGQVSND